MKKYLLFILMLVLAAPALAQQQSAPRKSA